MPDTVVAPAAPATPAPDKPVDPKAVPAAEPKAAEAKRKWAFEIDGKTVEEELTDSEIKERLQRAKGSEKRFEESAKFRKEAQALYKALKDDPESVLFDPSLGHSPEQIIERLVTKFGSKVRPILEKSLLQQIEDEKLDPKEKELRDLRRRNEETEKTLKERDEKEQNARIMAEAEVYRKDVQRQINEVLEKEKYSAHPMITARIAKYLELDLQHQIAYEEKHGRKRGNAVTVADVFPLVKEDLANEIKQLFGSYDEDALIGALGDELTEKIRKGLAKRVKNPTPQIQGQTKPASPASNGEPKKISMDEWNERMEKMKRGEL